MSSPYLDLPCFSLANTLKAGVNELLATMPSIMPNDLDHLPPSEDYRQLARRLRELARETQRPYARRELIKLSAMYEGRAGYLASRPS